MKRYVAKALRIRARELGVSPRALKRRVQAQPADTRGAFRAAKLRRFVQDVNGGAKEPTERG